MNKMIVKPFGETYEWATYASMTEFSFVESGLRLVLDSPMGNDDFVEFYFPAARAFKVLENCDHQNYWEQTHFRTDHLIYLIEQGGWRDSAKGRYMQVLNADSDVKSQPPLFEWFIIATEYCVSVISPNPPHIRSF